MINLEKNPTANKPQNAISSAQDALQLALFPVNGKRIEASFSGDKISSDGGALLLREVEEKTKTQFGGEVR